MPNRLRKRHTVKECPIIIKYRRQSISKKTRGSNRSYSKFLGGRTFCAFEKKSLHACLDWPFSRCRIDVEDERILGANVDAIAVYATPP